MDIAPLLAGAGIVGIALGFDAKITKAPRVLRVDNFGDSAIDMEVLVKLGR